MARRAKIHRKTSETDVSIEMNLDGTGDSQISTPIPFLNHMLDLFTKHGLFDLKIKSKGDTDIDDHHTVEDIGICLGEAVKKALADKRGIARYGAALVPMDESLCSVAVDLSGRPYLIYHVPFSGKKNRDFDLSLIKEFLKAFSDRGGITLHINLMYGRNNHHIAEAVFKAFSRALKEAVAQSKKIEGILSTKGSL
jgi:imidazoleglycerol-phosphate dehydratase